MNQIIGPYQIESELGRGGMGVVYRAHDTRLNRTVAIKALPPELASDAGRLERFEREARTLAQLNHPNLAGIHGLEKHEGQTYLVLEFVEGETLADRLDRGPLPIDEAVEFAAQIAAGVAAAHEAGIVHRDLKPANILVTPEGRAKVLDFGLARTDEGHSSSGSGMSQSPTMTTPAPPRPAQPQHSPTIPGAILGTAAYMSPEQARGRRVDQRTDVWSFGVVLYEMLVGASPFVGETAGDSIGAVLHKEFNLDRLPPSTPPSVRRVLRRCLQRDRDFRYHAIADARLELLSTSLDADAPAADTPARSNTLSMLLGALALLLVAALVAITLLRADREESALPLLPLRVALDPPEDARIMFKGDLSGPPVVSPDGRHVAFVAQRENEPRRLWIQTLDQTEPREVPGSEAAMFPFWSPDSAQIGFYTPGILKRTDLRSLTVEPICDVDQGRGAAWTEDGRIIFSRNFRDALSIVDARGGQSTPLTTLDEDRHTSHRWPSIIPGTSKYLFSAVSARVGDRDNNAIYLADLDSADPPRRVMSSNYSAVYHDGRLLHARDNVLLASRIDLDTAETLGNPEVITRDLDPDTSTWHAQFSISREGTLTYHRERTTAAADDEVEGYSWAAEGSRITAMRNDGNPITTYAEGLAIHSFSQSPDGRNLALAVIGSNGFPDIWIHPTVYSKDPDAENVARLAREAMGSPEYRLTSLPGAEMMPVWSPTSDEVAFRWDGGNTQPVGFYRKRLGGGSEQLVSANRNDDPGYLTHWTPDGRHLIAVHGTILLSDQNDIYAIPLDGGDWIPLVTDPGPDIDGVVSPDGRWLAYTNFENSTGNVWVIPFAPAWPETDDTRRWLVSDNGGVVPMWSPEGDELFYMSGAGILISVPVNITGDEFSYDPPQALFQAPWDYGQTYGVTPDSTNNPNGFNFLDSESDDAASIALILNWPALLETAND